jgi:hypothetical protein
MNADLIRKAYVDSSSHRDVRRHYHAALQYSPDTPDRPAAVFRRYQPGLVIGVWSCVIAMLPSSLQSRI